MSGLIRCKACGYVMNESHLKDLCPACGLPKTVFEPYTKKIAARRKFVIDQHLHPIAVHFPQVFLLLALILPVLALIVNDPVRAEMLIIAKWSILVLPFTVLGGLVTGLVDGKIRFKKITTPLLVNKMIAGVVLQVLSILTFSLYMFHGLTGNALWLIVGSNAVAMVCAIYLGKTGASLFESILPG